MAFDFVTGDTGSRLVVTCLYNDTGLPINLTGTIVKLNYTSNSGTLYTRNMTVLDTVAGIAEYRFAAGELLAPVITAEVEVTDNMGVILTSLDVLSLSVRQQIG
jgi:BppU N-terminal domain